MIPKNIRKNDVLKAMQQIDQEGVPKSRQSHTYYIQHNGKRYPPKYIISLANSKVNGSELLPAEFGGGTETNRFLCGLGFEIIPYQDSFEPQPQEPKIVTVTLQSSLNDYPKNYDRLKLLKAVVEKHLDSDVILFPAGYFYFEKQKPNQLREIAKTVCDLLKSCSSIAVICFGIDCDEGNDQLSVAIDSNGVLATGRKFYPTADEEGVIRAANQFDSVEMGYTRFFETCGKRFYMAVCYDCFGIRHREIKNPGVDAILVLAHQFRNRGEGPSGDVDFARKGFAGASQQWGCPVFGTAVFFDRKIPENWPTGVIWDGLGRSVKNFKYQDNKLHWKSRHTIQVGHELALCYKYTF